MNLQSFVKTLFYHAGYSIKRIRATPATARGAAASDANASRGNLLDLLHKKNPYQGFDFESYPIDAQGWGGDSPAFRELITRHRPSLIIEVGTWKGASALEMAAATRDLHLDTKILCVDTWLGALEFWKDQNDPDRYGSLQLRFGYPAVFYTFLANVCHKGFQDRIIPFPQTSAAAAQWLRYQGIKAEMIYIDASHEEEDVYQDLREYWDLLRAGGVIFGDDYTWDGVRLAVDRFAREEKLPLTFVADKWILEKSPR